jgi:hypothetical protein
VGGQYGKLQRAGSGLSSIQLTAARPLVKRSQIDIIAARASCELRLEVSAGKSCSSLVSHEPRSITRNGSYGSQGAKLLAIDTSTEGPAKQIDGPPRTFAKSQTHPPTIRLLFAWLFFQVRFWTFLGKESSKTPLKYFCKKSMSKNISKSFDKNFDVSFSSIFFCFIAFSGVSQRWEFNNTTKKNRVEKFLQKIKKIDQKSKTDFFSIFFITFLGVCR